MSFIFGSYTLEDKGYFSSHLSTYIVLGMSLIFGCGAPQVEEHKLNKHALHTIFRTIVVHTSLDTLGTIAVELK
jgi:hypothetical protein